MSSLSTPRLASSLLAPASFVDSSCDWDRTATPLTNRPYFKRVHFNKDKGETQDSKSNNLFPWTLLSEKDRILLSSFAHDLTTCPATTLTPLHECILGDVPPQVFLQRPSVYHSLLDLYVFSPSPAIRLHAGQCLLSLCRRLSACLSRPDFQPASTRTSDETEEEEDDDERSYEDEMDEMRLRREALSPQDLVLLTASAVAVAWRNAGGPATMRLNLALLNCLTSVVDKCGGLEGHEDILRDLANDFEWNLVKCSHDRIWHLSLLDCLSKMCVKFPLMSRDLAGIALSDPTLFSSHPELHSRWCRLASEQQQQEWSQAELVLEKLSKAAKFLRGSKTDMTHFMAAEELSDLHQSSLFVEKSFELLTSDKLIIDDKVTLACCLLKKTDHLFAADVFLRLHSLVQKGLGLSRYVGLAEEVDSKLDFLYQSSEVVNLIIKHGFRHQLEVIQTASEEIVLYLLKNCGTLGGTEHLRLTKVLEQILPLLVSFSEDKTNVGREMLNFLSNEKHPLRTHLHSKDLTILKLNLQMLFSKNMTARKQAEVNLKFLLAKESSEKLPKFADILAEDISGYFVNVGKRSAIYPSREIASAVCDVTEQLVRSMQRLSRGEEKREWMHLEVMLQDAGAMETFDKVQGIPFTKHMLKDILTSNTPLNWISEWLAVFKVIMSHPQHRKEFSQDMEFMLLLSRCLFLPSTEPCYKENLTVSLFTMLFDDAITKSDSGALGMDRCLLSNLFTPLALVEEEEETVLPKAMHVKAKFHRQLKTAWSQNLKKADSKSHNFASSLVLSDSEMSLIEWSYVSTSIPVTVENLSCANNHQSFRSNMHLLAAYLTLFQGVPDKSTKRLEKTLKRFFTTQPKTEEDRLLLLDVTQCMTDILARQKEARETLFWLPGSVSLYKLLTFVFSESRFSSRDADIVKAFFDVVARCFSDAKVELTLPEPFLPLGKLDLNMLDMILSVAPSTIVHNMTETDIAVWLNFLDKKPGGSFKETKAVETILQTLNHVTAEQLLVSDQITTFCNIWSSYKNKMIQILALQLTCKICNTTEGAQNVSQYPGVWRKLLAIARTGVDLSVRRGSLRLMSRLIDASCDGRWFGPAAVEPVSGVKLAWDSAMVVFAKDHHLQDVVVAAIGEMEASLRGGSDRQISYACDFLLDTLLFWKKFALTQYLNEESFVTMGKIVEVYKEAHERDSLKSPRWRGLMVEVIDILNCSANSATLNNTEKVPAILAIILQEVDHYKNDDMVLGGCTFVARLLLSDCKWRKELIGLVEKYIIRIVLITDNRTTFGEAENCHYLQFLAAVLKLFLERRNNRLSLALDQEASGEPPGKALCLRVLGLLSNWPILHDELSSQAIFVLKYLLRASFQAQLTAIEGGFIGRCVQAWKNLMQDRNVTQTKKCLRVKELIDVLGALCHRNQKAKEALAQSGFPSLLSTTMQTVWSLKAHLREEILLFLTSCCHQCEMFRRSLCYNKGADIEAFVNTSSNGVLTFVVDKAKSHGLSKETTSFFMTMALNATGRKMILRSSLFDNLVYPSSSTDVLVLDLLLSLTSFSDGQLHVLAQTDLVGEYLLPAVAQTKRKDIKTLAMTVLRNISLLGAPAFTKLGQTRTTEILRDILEKGDEKDARETTLALETVWALSSNNLKAKVSFAKGGITGLLCQENSDDELLARVRSVLLKTYA